MALVHVILGLQDTRVDRAEQQAEEFACLTLIPREAAARLPPLRTAADIETCADQTGVGPGVVAGRLQHDKVLRRSVLNVSAGGTLPMALCRRIWCHLSTHSAVAGSTCSRDRQGPPAGRGPGSLL
jgi:hypothetical protein